MMLLLVVIICDIFLFSPWICDCSEIVDWGSDKWCFEWWCNCKTWTRRQVLSLFFVFFFCLIVCLVFFFFCFFLFFCLIVVVVVVFKIVISLVEWEIYLLLVCNQFIIIFFKKELLFGFKEMTICNVVFVWNKWTNLSSLYGINHYYLL